MIRCGLLLLTLLLILTPVRAQVPLPTTPPQTDNFIDSPRLGLTFINSAEAPIKAERYRQARFLGAGWTRWPLYIQRVETAPGQYNWGAYDLLVAEDLRYGLRINAILLGRDSIGGLQQAVFADGSDTPGPGKTINPANPWASFVYAAVQRYKPGGALAQLQGWPADWGVRVWEAWNEPDIPLFWNRSVDEYVRLLKITYLAARHADPGAQVMFAGIADALAPQDFFAQALARIAQDPQAAQHNWYMDLVAVHSYSYARRTAGVVRHVRDLLAARGLTRPVWLNETGVPVWNDYPGPTWAANIPQSRVLRATTQQQAAYIIQSAAYAWAEGAEVVMVHQLYDDCGNQPGGTNFPPHDGSLCAGGTPCWGDAHGLFRNTADSSCFSQHPLPGTPRPAAGAFRLLAEIFGVAPFEPEAAQLVDQRGVVISFRRPSSRERIHVAWNRSLQPLVLDLPASGQLATLYTLDGQDFILTPDSDLYRVTLAPATPDDFPYLVGGDGAAVGGPPVIIVEQAARDSTVNPALPQFEPQPQAPPPPAASTPAPVVQVARPTVDPAADTNAPVAVMIPLPVVSPPTFTLAWDGQDDSGIAAYLVWVRIDGGEWQPWLETDQTRADFNGETGRRYEFAVWAVDLAGNWSLNTELAPQAVTSVAAP
jgi:hypothetical protein